MGIKFYKDKVYYPVTADKTDKLLSYVTAKIGIYSNGIHYIPCFVNSGSSLSLCKTSTTTPYQEFFGNTSSPTICVRKDNVTYYALKHWDDTDESSDSVKSRYVVNFTYTANGGNGSNVTETIYGTIDGSNAGNFKSNPFTRNHYDFSKWNTSADGAGTSYSVNQAITNAIIGSTNKTLYAIWTPKTYTCIYHANGVASSDVTQSYTVESKPKTKGDIFTRTYYTLTNWASPSGTLYSKNTDYFPLPDDLYAQWTPITYTCTYHANGGSGSDVAQSYTYENQPTTKGDIFTKTYYTLTKWADSSGTSYNKNTTRFPLPNDLYAQWTPITYTCTYNANGGVGSDVTQSYTYESKPTTKGDIFTRANYYLSSWRGSNNGTTYYKNTTYFPLDTLLCAQWSSITYSNWAYSKNSYETYKSTRSNYSSNTYTRYDYYRYNYTVSVQITNGSRHTYYFSCSKVSGNFDFTLSSDTSPTTITNNSITTLSCTLLLDATTYDGSSTAEGVIYLYDATTGKSVQSTSMFFSQSLTLGNIVDVEG